MGNTSKVDVDCVHYGYVGDGESTEMVFLDLVTWICNFSAWGELQEHLEGNQNDRPPLADH
jgi:hypothetical protein